MVAVVAVVGVEGVIDVVLATGVLTRPEEGLVAPLNRGGVSNPPTEIVSVIYAVISIAFLEATLYRLPNRKSSKNPNILPCW